MAGTCRNPRWFWYRVYLLGVALMRWSGVGEQIQMRLKVDTSEFDSALLRVTEALGEAFDAIKPEVVR